MTKRAILRPIFGCGRRDTGVLSGNSLAIGMELLRCRIGRQVSSQRYLGDSWANSQNFENHKRPQKRQIPLKSRQVTGFQLISALAEVVVSEDML